MSDMRPEAQAAREVATQTKLERLRQAMREHTDAAGGNRCYCAECCAANSEIVALLVAEAP